MAYRESRRFSRQLAAARAERERLRVEGPAPDYPADRPALRREVLVIDHDFGSVAHYYQLWESGRVNSYRVVENDVAWQGRHGWARFLALVRQRFPALRAAC